MQIGDGRAPHGVTTRALPKPVLSIFFGHTAGRAGGASPVPTPRGTLAYHAARHDRPKGPGS
eukprot:11180953-Lingulodinium_polyedra.AAC.1